MTNDVNKGNTPPKENEGGSGKYVIGLLILCAAAFLSYQVFFCPTCYGITEKYAPDAAKTAPQ
jgi:hypothetical protein